MYGISDWFQPILSMPPSPHGHPTSLLQWKSYDPKELDQGRAGVRRKATNNYQWEKEEKTKHEQKNKNKTTSGIML
jgi:hypothetical protein